MGTLHTSWPSTGSTASPKFRTKEKKRQKAARPAKIRFGRKGGYFWPIKMGNEIIGESIEISTNTELIDLKMKIVDISLRMLPALTNGRIQKATDQVKPQNSNFVSDTLLKLDESSEINHRKLDGDKLEQNSDDRTCHDGQTVGHCSKLSKCKLKIFKIPIAERNYQKAHWNQVIPYRKTPLKLDSSWTFSIFGIASQNSKVLLSTARIDGRNSLIDYKNS